VNGRDVSPAALEIRALDKLAGVELRQVIAGALSAQLDAVRVHLPRPLVDGMAEALVGVVVAAISTQPRVTASAELNRRFALVEQATHAIACMMAELAVRGVANDALVMHLGRDVNESVLPQLARLP
jgi:hypothetical protein